MDNPTISPLRLPGATQLTRLKVYDTPAPDGQPGGTPHVHFLCTEMYYVLAGSGAVEMIDAASGFSRVPLAPNAALVFSPGTIHRLINPNGDLELLVLMQNSGLPESGDNAVCFAPEWLSDDQRFAEAMQVRTVDEAYRRRDRGVEGFLALKAAFARDMTTGREALAEFYRLAAERMAPLRQGWEQVVNQGALQAAQESLHHLTDLAENRTAYLHAAQHRLIQPGEYTKVGFCGHLNPYPSPTTLTPEGITQA